MSDVDDELLALAGGGESSDEDVPQKRARHSAAASNDEDGEEHDGAPTSTRRSRSATGSRPVSRGYSPARDNDSPGSSGQAAKKSSAKKSRRRAQSDDESEEEGEASQPSTPSSQQSAPMEESDSDSEANVVSSKKARAAVTVDDDDDENKYPVDGLFATHEEKEEIMNMREVDREQILAERAQEKDRIHQNKLLRQLVSNDEQRKKRSASAADLDEGQRKTSRVRTKLGGTKVGETHSAIDTLKSRRAEKRRREEDRERRKDRPSSRGGRSGHSDDDGDDDANYSADDGDSDVEWAKPSKKSRSPEPKVSQVTELRDVERVRLSRSRFGQVCFYPGFNEKITGTFVRISIGPDPDTREPVYRMALVKGFTKGKPYAISGPQGQMIVTDQYVLAAHGKAQREWPFLACSDSPFTESEWSRYQKVCHADNVSIPKRGLLLNKADDINQLISRKWTEQELVEKVDRQQELKSRFNGVDRMRLETLIKEAKALGNTDRALKLQEELDSLETPRLAFRTSLTASAKSNSGPTQQERLAQLNAENRRRNAEAVRKAQLRERKKARDIERRIENGEDVEEDTSRRVKTKAKFVHDVNDSGATPEKKPSSQAGSGASTPANGTPRLGATKASGSGLLPHLAKLKQQQQSKNGLPMLHKPIVEDDIIASLDLDIDDDIFD
ncbi:RNA polymerase-associated protein rtf1 [Sporothrix curviconia]|uniref:RNA polymerase-associated protein rtf1 n=1 Tax=Sporothrix curviconia TaxID=1260050 RepID=A0ABP0AVP5_9PEZI